MKKISRGDKMLFKTVDTSLVARDSQEVTILWALGPDKVDIADVGPCFGVKK